MINLVSNLKKHSFLNTDELFMWLFFTSPPAHKKNRHWRCQQRFSYRLTLLFFAL